MKKIINFLVVVFSFSVFADSEIIDGITWNYTVTSGLATIVGTNRYAASQGGVNWSPSPNNHYRFQKGWFVFAAEHFLNVRHCVMLVFRNPWLVLSRHFC